MVSIEEVLDGPDLPALLEVWHHTTERDPWRSIEKKATEAGDADQVDVAQHAIAEHQDVSVVDGLRANERIVSLLTGWRWQAKCVKHGKKDTPGPRSARP